MSDVLFPVAARDAAAKSQTRYRISGMDCGSCAAKIERALRQLPGVSDIEISVPAGTLTLRHPAAITSAAIEQQVRTLGYQAAGIEDAVGPMPGSAAHSHQHDHG